MPSLVPGFEYDVFISYRHNDNRSGWVKEFVSALQEELAATIKESVSVYFDSSPHDGLSETHDVDESLKGKLNCLIFIPILSQTYCDQKSFAWKHEFLVFKRQAQENSFTLRVKLQNGNVASRVLPIRIHDLDAADLSQIEAELGSVLRPVNFIYRSPGVARPLLPNEVDPKSNHEHTYYRDQVNKVARAIKELIAALKSPGAEVNQLISSTEVAATGSRRKMAIAAFLIIMLAAGIYYFGGFGRVIAEPDKSIAVLPFDDLSPNHDQEHFGIGMMDEILNDLFKLSDLKVTSRTSSMSYKGTNKPLREISRELNVANILAGSVQKEGESIRIRVQLIDGRTDAHIWAETYERKFKDVFSIQSEIAHAVAAALKIRISHETEEVIEKHPTTNMEAYDLYMQAATYYWWEKSDSINTFYRDVELLDKAVSLDSGFAEAYARLASNWLNAGGNSGNMTSAEVLAKVTPFVQKALKLNPDLVSAHYANAILHLYYDLDFQLVENEYQRIRQLNPSNLATMGFLSEYLSAIGRFGEAVEIARNNFQQDQKSATNWCLLGQAYYYNNQVDKSLEMMNTANEIFKEVGFVMRSFIQQNTYAGNYDEAIRRYEKSIAFFSANEKSIAFQTGNAPIILSPVAASYFKTGKTDKAKELLGRMTEMSKKSPVRSPSFFAASVYAVMGDKQNAFHYLEKAIADKEVEIYWTKVYPLFQSLHDDPRWHTLVGKLKYPAN